MYRSRNLMLSFLIAGLLFFPAAASTVVAQTAPLITAQRLKLIAETILRVSHDPARIGANVAVPLGLSASGHAMTKQIGDKTAEGTHVFAVPIPARGRYLIFLIKDNGTVHVYACDINGKLLAAGIVINDNFAPVSISKAMPGFEAELRYWNTTSLPD